MKHFIFIFSILFFVSAFDQNSLDDAKQKVTDSLGQLPDSVKDVLPKGLDVNQVPSIEEGEELLQERCLRYGTNESFDNAMVAKEDVQFCIRGLVNFTQVEQEIEKAKPTGDLDRVFRKYCKKTPEMRQCITNFTEAIEPCLSPEERGSKYTIMNITDALSNFICFKEGDRIALFIAEGGPDCIKSKQDEIQQCLNTTFSEYIPKEMPDKEDLPAFNLGEKECQKFEDLQKCVVKHLEKCSEPTPANIVDSLMTFVRKSTPCHKYKRSSDAPSAASSTFSYTAVALGALLTLVVRVH